jgi:hypothetical protein
MSIGIGCDEPFFSIHLDLPERVCKESITFLLSNKLANYTMRTFIINKSWMPIESQEIIRIRKGEDIQIKANHCHYNEINAIVDRFTPFAFWTENIQSFKHELDSNSDVSVNEIIIHHGHLVSVLFFCI